MQEILAYFRGSKLQDNLKVLLDLVIQEFFSLIKVLLYKRILSIGFSAHQLGNVICQGHCNHACMVYTFILFTTPIFISSVSFHFLSKHTRPLCLEGMKMFSHWKTHYPIHFKNFIHIFYLFLSLSFYHFPAHFLFTHEIIQTNSNRVFPNRGTQN